MNSSKNTTLMVVLTAVGSILSSVYQLAQLRQQETKSDALVMSVMNAQAIQIEGLQKEVEALKARPCGPDEPIQTMQFRMKAKPDEVASDADGLPDVAVEMGPPVPSFERLRENAAQGKVWRQGKFVAY